VNKEKFAIAASTFDKYSETFIRNHAEKIFPRDTALIALDPNGVFIPGFSSEDCFRFFYDDRFIPKQVDSLWRLIVGGSVFYPGDKMSSQLAEFLKKRGIRVLLAEYGYVGCAVQNACRLAGVRLYVHFHGFDASQLLRHWHIRYAYRRLFRSVKGFIFPSQYLAEHLCSTIGIQHNNFIKIVPCCVQPKHFNATQAKDKDMLVSVARFVAKKAPQNTILAFSKVLCHFPDARLEMIGDGELLQACKDLVESLGLADKVLFHGSKSSDFVKEKLEKAQLFLQHSVTASNGDTEGLPVAVLEAMASGAVVVATKHSGIPEAVVHGETGFIVPEHDVEAMSQHCIQLLKDDELLVSMRGRARERVKENFTVEQQIVSLRGIMGLHNAQE
jgi:glycosyltransferase involved in cell wall biosynthesis